MYRRFSQMSDRDFISYAKKQKYKGCSHTQLNKRDPGFYKAACRRGLLGNLELKGILVRGSGTRGHANQTYAALESLTDEEFERLFIRDYDGLSVEQVRNRAPKVHFELHRRHLRVKLANMGHLRERGSQVPYSDLLYRMGHYETSLNEVREAQ